ncbi:hypothetical protein GGF46_003891 [Coemansia sp. RSA 552]|nr:hypothetical protein GGF46_003891 [Coemansia sp. RSA 552]
MTFFDRVLRDVGAFAKVESAEEEVCELYGVYYASSGSDRLDLVDGRKQEVEVEIPGTQGLTLTLRQNPHINSEPGQTGAVLWSSSVVMSGFLAQKSAVWGLHEANVIELGSGCGLVGIALHRLGAQRVVLTDQARVMRLLTRNADLNRLVPTRRNRNQNPPTLLVTEFEWGRPPQDPCILEYPVDLIVVSDCVYHEDVAPLLVHTLKDVCRGGRTVALVGQELRSDLVHQVFLEGLLEAGFAVHRVPMDKATDTCYVLYAMWLLLRTIH